MSDELCGRCDESPSPLRRWMVKTSDDGLSTSEEIVTAERMSVSDAGCLIFANGNRVVNAYGDGHWFAVHEMDG